MKLPQLKPINQHLSNIANQVAGNIFKSRKISQGTGILGTGGPDNTPPKVSQIHKNLAGDQNSKKELLKAIIAGDTNKVTNLLVGGEIDVNASFEVPNLFAKITPIGIAAARGDIDMINLLIENNAVVNPNIEEVEHPLSCAVQHIFEGCTGIKEKDIEENIEFKGDLLDTINALFEKGADPNSSYNASFKNGTNFFQAILALPDNEKSKDILKSFIKNGADINAQGERLSGNTIYMQDGDDAKEVVKMKLNLDYTPLVTACIDSKWGLARTLLDNGARIINNGMDTMSLLEMSINDNERDVPPDIIVKLKEQHSNEKRTETDSRTAIIIGIDKDIFRNMIANELKTCEDPNTDINTMKATIKKIAQEIRENWQMLSQIPERTNFRLLGAVDWPIPKQTDIENYIFHNYRPENHTLDHNDDLTRADKFIIDMSVF